MGRRPVTLSQRVDGRSAACEARAFARLRRRVPPVRGVHDAPDDALDLESHAIAVFFGVPF